MILYIDYDPILQDPSQEPLTSSKFLMENRNSGQS